MIREDELDEMRQELKKAAEFDLDKEFHNTIDPTGSLREGLKPPELPDFSMSGTMPAAAVEGRAETAATSSGETAPQREKPPEPVPMVAGPPSEPDESAAPGSATAPAEPTRPPAETGAHGFVPPKP
jgi:hypothetical protein